MHLGRELAELGHNVDVYAYIPRMVVKRYSPGGVTYHSLFGATFPSSFFALSRISRSRQLNSTEYLLKQVDGIISRRMGECDVYIGLSGMAVESLKFAKQRYGSLTICDRGSAHVLVQKETLEVSPNSKLNESYVQRELEGYGLADLIAVPSLFAKNSFLDQNITEERIFLNNYGVNLTRFSKLQTVKSLDEARIRILFVGGWGYRKGCDLITASLNHNIDFEVTHAGTPGDLPFPLSDRFRSIGHIDNCDLASIYQTHDVLVLPSREDGFGMVILEALASGTPVVASKNSGGPDVKRNITNQDFVQIMNNSVADELTHCVRMAFRAGRENQHSRLSESDVNYFSWGAYAKRYERFLLDRLNIGQPK
jgi:glycosyltransferase involved in cell wall biosynthesis